MKKCKIALPDKPKSEHPDDVLGYLIATNKAEICYWKIVMLAGFLGVLTVVALTISAVTFWDEHYAFFERSDFVPAAIFSLITSAAATLEIEAKKKKLYHYLKAYFADDKGSGDALDHFVKLQIEEYNKWTLEELRKRYEKT